MSVRRLGARHMWPRKTKINAKKLWRLLRPSRSRSTFEIIIVLRKHERGACVCLFVYPPMTSYVYSREGVGGEWTLTVVLHFS